MPSIHFTKTGTQHYPSTGERVITKYHFHADGITDGILTDLYKTKSVLRFNERTITIESMTWGIFLTGNYRVMENETSIRKIKQSGWDNARPRIILAHGEKFVMEKPYTNFGDSFKISKTYTLLLRNDRQVIKYTFTTNFQKEEKGGVEHFRYLEGTIETNNDDLLLPLLGLFLVEIILKSENQSYI